VVLGVGILVGASQQIINSTFFFAEIFHISPFFISLIVVSLGTNIPEISLIIRSILSAEKDIALADYLGSASTNTLLFAVFSLIYGKTIYLPNHFLQRFAFLGTGLVLFFFFARSKATLSRLESLVLFCFYANF
jgi:cation:H+ antiporter